MVSWMQGITAFEPVALAVLALLLGSLVHGLVKGASGSAKRLFFFVWEGLLMLICIAAASKAASLLSPVASKLLSGVHPPDKEVGKLMQLWYTFVTSFRDFALFRYGVLLLICYAAFRWPLAYVTAPIERFIYRLGTKGGRRSAIKDEDKPALPGARLASRAIGGMIGACHGAVRSLLLIAALFIYTTLSPSGPMTTQIRSSEVYNEASARLLEPVAGKLLDEQGPVITKAVGDELQRILQRKYEIADYAIPDDISEAALAVTKNEQSDEEKARALYRWVGTRIAYDWDKARNYEQRGIWKEQTPEDTFDTRLGVCIDVARLYAVMARASGLQVRVVTGQGGTAANGFGPHAWNEVQIAGDNGSLVWVPLDATWAMSGDWFNPPDFGKTHIADIEA